MRQLIISDLHLELGTPLNLPLGGEFDVVVLAGDIHNPGRKSASDVATKLAEHPATTGLDDAQPVLQEVELLEEGKRVRRAYSVACSDACLLGRPLQLVVAGLPVGQFGDQQLVEPATLVVGELALDAVEDGLLRGLVFLRQPDHPARWA